MTNTTANTHLFSVQLLHWHWTDCSGLAKVANQYNVLMCRQQ